MSSHLWNLVKKELRELLTPSALISVLVVVVLFIAMGSFLGGGTKEATSAKHIGYIDLTENSGTDDYSHIGLEGLRDYYRAMDLDPHEYVIQLHSVTAEYGTDEFDSQLYDAMEKENVDTALVIMKDFDDNLRSTPMKNGDIAVYWDQKGLGIFSSIGLATSETAKAVKAANEADAKAKADAKATQEKAELEEFERQQKEARRNAELNPWGAGRLNRTVQPDPELLKELDKNGPIKGPDVLPHGGGVVRPSVKLD